VAAITEQPAPAPAAAAPRPIRLVADALFGKERRVRPFDDEVVDPALGGEFGQCSPLLGVKLGVAKRFENNWELAGLAGVAFSLVQDDDKVREHQVFVDAELNYYFSNDVLLGGGLSLWDLTRSDTFTPAALVHVAFPLARGRRVPTFLMFEGRLFFDGIDEIDNNYQFWGGLRLYF
jgi:hypothetical protein